MRVYFVSKWTKNVMKIATLELLFKLIVILNIVKIFDNK